MLVVPMVVLMQLRIVSLCGAETVLPYLSSLDVDRTLMHSHEATEESIVSLRGLSQNFINARVKVGLDIVSRTSSCPREPHSSIF